MEQFECQAVEYRGPQCYLKIEHFYGNVPVPKWCKVGKQLLLICKENFSSFPEWKFNTCTNVFISFIMIKMLNYVQFYTKHNTFTTFSDTLGLILLADAQHKLRQSTDAHRLLQLGAETLSVVTREGGSARPLWLLEFLLPVITALCKNKHWILFLLFALFCKSKNPLVISLSRQKQVVMYVFHKSEVVYLNLQDVASVLS